MHRLLSLREPHLVNKDYGLKVVGSWGSFRSATSIYFFRNLPMITAVHGTLGLMEKEISAAILHPKCYHRLSPWGNCNEKEAWAFNILKSKQEMSTFLVKDYNLLRSDNFGRYCHIKKREDKSYPHTQHSTLISTML